MIRFLLLLVSASASVFAFAADEIALVQYNADLHFADYAHNMKELRRFADQAVSRGSKVIVFPEGSAYGYASSNALWCKQGVTRPGCRDVREAAEKIPGGRTTTAWEAYAREHGVHVLYNLPEIDGSKFYNTTAVVGPEGYVSKYRKRALYVTDEYYATPGNLGAVVVKTPVGEFGLLICMDANDRDYYEEYKSRGVSHLIIPMDWDEDPNGSGGARPARTFFQQMARKVGMDLFVSDVSAWDGTGKYPRAATVRERNGLAPIAIGVDGVSYHSAY